MQVNVNNGQVNEVTTKQQKIDEQCKTPWRNKLEQCESIIETTDNKTSYSQNINRESAKAQRHGHPKAKLIKETAPQTKLQNNRTQPKTGG